MVVPAHRWLVHKKRDASGHDHGADGRFGSGGSGKAVGDAAPSSPAPTSAEEGARDAWETVVGVPLKAATARSLTGIPVDAEVNIRTYEHPSKGPMVEVTGKGDGYKATRLFYRDKAGDLVVVNHGIVTGNDRRGGGTSAFAAQVEALRKAGAKRIETTAGGDAKSGTNGYYTLPRWGYDGEIGEEQLEALPADVRRAMGKDRSLRNLFDNVPGGKEAWKAHGSELKVSFDLAADSPSSTALAAYAAARAKSKVLKAARPWVVKIRDASGHEHAKDGRFGSGGGASARTPDRHGKPTASGPVIRDAVADLPAEIKDDRSALTRVMRAAAKLHVKLYPKLMKLGLLVHEYAADVLDTAEDFESIAKAKTGTGQPLGAATGNDPIYELTGMPGYWVLGSLVPKIAGAVVAKLAKRKALDAWDDAKYLAVAKATRKLWLLACREIGVEMDLPSVREIVAHLKGKHAKAKRLAAGRAVAKGKTASRYGCLMANLTGDAARRVLAAGRSIPDADLAEDGRETEPHVTVRYGFTPEADVADVERIASRYGPLLFQFGPVGVFAGDKHDVVYYSIVPAEGPAIASSPLPPPADRGLWDLNAALADLPHVDTHPTYVPHACIAYVKAGLGEKYRAALDSPRGSVTAFCTELVYSAADRSRSVIPLTGVKSLRRHPWMVFKAWDPGKHKRGQPDNAGQFGSGGGGAKDKPAHDDPRHNPDLDAAFAEEAPKPKPAAGGDSRANPALDEFMTAGDEPPRHPSRHNAAVDYANPDDRDSDDRHVDQQVAAAKQAQAEVAQIKQQIAAAEKKQRQAAARPAKEPPAVRRLRAKLERAKAKEAKAKERLATVQSQRPAGAQPQGTPPTQTGRMAAPTPPGGRAFPELQGWKPAVRPASVEPEAGPPKGPATPPELPHYRTQAAAVGAAKAVQAAAQTGGDVRAAHVRAIAALADHAREGFAAIDRLARGDPRRAARAKAAFAEKVRAVRAKLDALAGGRPPGRAQPPPLPRRKSLPAGLSKLLLPVRVTKGKDSGGGRWITIGGEKGAAGKRHGGSPVYIENGRITKGHPSLIGKDPSNLDAPSKNDTHRRQLNQSKDYEKARWRKKARQAGHDPKHLESLAGDIKAHHDAFAEERKEVHRHARDHSKKNFDADLRGVGANARHGSSDHTSIRGFDETTESTVAAYPHHFHEETGEHGSHEDQLHAMLVGGDPKPMEWDEAYSTAFDQLGEVPTRGRKRPKKEPGGDSFDFGANEIPKALCPVAAYRTAAHPWLVHKAARISVLPRGRYRP